MSCIYKLTKGWLDSAQLWNKFLRHERNLAKKSQVLFAEPNWTRSTFRQVIHWDLFKPRYNSFLSKVWFEIIQTILFNIGTFCLLSYNTGLDLHDCVCLLPTGKLILHLLESTYEKIPVNFNKKTSKSTGFTKYGMCFFVNS